MSGNAIDAAPIAAPVRRALLPNVFWTFIGTSAITGAQFIVVVILARLGSPASVGEWAFAQAVCTPVMLLASLSLRKVQATDAAGRFQFTQYVTLRVLTTTTAFVALIAYALYRGGTTSLSLTMIGVAIARSVDSFSDVVFGALQRVERMERIGRSQIVSSVTFIAVAAIALSQHVSAPRAAAAMIAGNVVALVTVDLRSYALLRRMGAVDARLWRLTREDVLPLARLSAPLGAATSLTSLIVNIPRLILEWFRGTAALGVFAAIHYIVICVNLFVGAVAQAVLPRFAHDLNRGDKDALRRLMGILGAMCGAVSAAIVLITIFLGPRLLRGIYGDAYSHEYVTLNILGVATAIGVFNWFLDYLVTAAGSFKELLTIAGAAAVVSAIVGFFAIPRLGAAGAALSLLCGMIVQVTPRLIMTARLLRDSEQRPAL
jgi:O-antigen/teichoic acid export membrane protein